MVRLILEVLRYILYLTFVEWVHPLSWFLPFDVCGLVYVYILFIACQFYLYISLYTRQ